MIRPGLFLQPFVVSQLIGEVIADVVEGSGVSGSEFAVTSSIAVWPEVSPTELARMLGMSPTTLSAVLNRLEGKGQVRRRRDPDDGRRFVLELTAKGKRTREQNLERFSEWIARVRGHFGGDPEEVLEPMRRLEQALRAALEE
ncbi:MAG TPA: MarR family winged helix-turn-helix transcriptional regulator [Gaiellaceae bacterium]